MEVENPVMESLLTANTSMGNGAHMPLSGALNGSPANGCNYFKPLPNGIPL